MNTILVDRVERKPRVPFAQPVRVVPLGGPPRAFRVLAKNLSHGGMFLSSKEPFDEGTKVALSLEASGRVLPFAQGEVVWRRYGEGGSGPGFGVRFTGFLHPRAHDMVGHLVHAIETGAPLPMGDQKPHSWKQVALAGAASLVLGATVTAAFLALVGGSTHETLEPEPAVVTAPAPEATAQVVQLAPMVLDGAPRPPAQPEGAGEPKQRAQPRRAEALAAPSAATEPEALAELVQPAVPPTPAALPVAPVEGRSLTLHSGAATRMGWSRSGGELSFTLTLKPQARVEKAFLLDAPPRLAIDLSGGAPDKSLVLDGPDATLFVRVRVGRSGASSTRLVIDLPRPASKVAERGPAIVVSY